MKEVSQSRLPELDGWRAVSVLLVILHHYGWFQHPQLVPKIRGLGHFLHYCGPLGVKVFFVISGFVICRLISSEDRRYGSVSLKGFYCRRVFRILPPLFLYIGTIALLCSFGLIHESPTAFRNALMFLNDLDVHPYSWLLGHTWSLAVEEQFYLIFPTMWILTPQRFKGRVFTTALLFCAASNLSMAFTGWKALIYSDTRAGFTCICCGVVMAIYERRLRSLAGHVPAFVVAIIGLILLVHPCLSEDWPAALYESLVVPAAIGLVLLFSLVRGPWLRVFLCSSPAQVIGITSYGIYLWQQLFTAPRQYLFAGGGVIPLLIPLICAIVPLSYFLVEVPAIHYGKSLSQRYRDAITACSRGTLQDDLVKRSSVGV